MPGVFGGLVAMGLVAFPLWQLAGITLTVIFAVMMGVVVGFVASKLGKKGVPYDDEEEFIFSE